MSESLDNEAAVAREDASDKVPTVKTEASVAAPDRSHLYAQPRMPYPRVWPLFTIAALVVVADQWLKWWIRFNIGNPGDTLPLLPGVAHWSHVWNWGAAWGVFAGARWPLIIVSSAVCCAIIFLCRRIGANGRAALVAAGLILGGAVGNLIDRVKFGYVLDMIDMDTQIPLIRDFPVFNLADSALTLGVIILLVMSFWPAPKKL
jgi:signal peptidase II